MQLRKSFCAIWLWNRYLTEHCACFNQWLRIHTNTSPKIKKITELVSKLKSFMRRDCANRRWRDKIWKVSWLFETRQACIVDRGWNIAWIKYSTLLLRHLVMKIMYNLLWIALLINSIHQWQPRETRLTAEARWILLNRRKQYNFKFFVGFYMGHPFGNANHKSNQVSI